MQVAVVVVVIHQMVAVLEVLVVAVLVELQTQQLQVLLTQVVVEAALLQAELIVELQEVQAWLSYPYLQHLTLERQQVAQQSQLADLIQSSSGPQQVQVHTQLKDKLCQAFYLTEIHQVP
jgi:hypothetical protein